VSLRKGSVIGAFCLSLFSYVVCTRMGNWCCVGLWSKHGLLGLWLWGWVCMQFAGLQQRRGIYRDIMFYDSMQVVHALFRLPGVDDPHAATQAARWVGAGVAK
jgi:hypothetical protein